MKKKIIVVGLGNTGKCTVDALQESPDLECAGILRRAPAAAGYKGVKEYANIADLPQKPNCAILCLPSKMMPAAAKELLLAGISTVDSFDIHSEVAPTVAMLEAAAKEGKAAAIVSAGWDPGSDSIIRAVFTALEPGAKIYTTFGPGMSMGHSVAARAVKGVEDAISITLPAGSGAHKRKVYAVAAPGYSQEQIYAAIKADNYFAHDELEVELVPDIAPYKNAAHGGRVEMAHNQTKAQFAMTVHNPRATANVMVACARAALRMAPGAYTIIDLPPVALLPGTREENIKALV